MAEEEKAEAESNAPAEEEQTEPEKAEADPAAAEDTEAPAEEAEAAAETAEAAPAEPEEEGPKLTAREIEKMNVPKLKEAALQYGGKITSVHGMDKTQLIRTLKEINGIPLQESRESSKIDRQAVKLKIKALRRERDSAIEGKDPGHDFSAVRPGADVAVIAGLVAELTDVDLEGGQGGSVEAGHILTYPMSKAAHRLFVFDQRKGLFDGHEEITP